MQKASCGVNVIVKSCLKRIPAAPGAVKKAVLLALSGQKPGKCGQITVYLVGDKKIRRLNLKYLGSDCSTDVIAFDASAQGEAGDILADIFVSRDTARANAARFNTSSRYEMLLYAAHGALHLLGYDHRTRRQELLMRQEERRVLKRLGVL